MVNKVMLIGHLGADPEVRYTTGGQAVASFRVATSRKWTDKQSNQQKEETYWGTVNVWGKQAELCGEHLTKGALVYVEGRLKTDTWDDKQTGQKRFRDVIVADVVRFLDKRKGDAAETAEQAERTGSGEPAASGGSVDDIPF